MKTTNTETENDSIELSNIAEIEAEIPTYVLTKPDLNIPLLGPALANRLEEFDRTVEQRQKYGKEEGQVDGVYMFLWEVEEWKHAWIIERRMRGSVRHTTP